MLVTANIFQPLIDVFESVLKFFHNNVGISWGLSIVLLTICVRAVLIPLTLRQIKSMVRMQSFAPQMKELQAKYKDDKERQSQEMMKFYKENNVNPLGSCLPLVLQLPVFVSLYYMLKESLRRDICPAVQDKYQQAYALKHHVSLAVAHGHTTECGSGGHASFLFIGDLTAKATGITLVVLLILYVGSQLFSMVVMSPATVDPMQRRLMMFMPLIFVLFVYRFPAGVLVYWITTNLWTIGQQWVVKRQIGPVQAANAAVAAGGGGSGGSGGGGGGSRSSGPRGKPPALNAGSNGAPTASSSNGGSGAGAGIGRLGSMLRDRLAPPAKEPEKVASGGSNSGGSNSGGSGSSGSGGGSRTRTSGSGSGSAAKSRSKPGSGSGRGSSGSAATPADGPPPRPPRKRKKRSGRRR
jgi:YidC/Oxa1 family membrane protein insertase